MDMIASYWDSCKLPVLYDNQHLIEHTHMLLCKSQSGFEYIKSSLYNTAEQVMYCETKT